MCLKKMGLHPRNMIIVIGWTANTNFIWGGLYDHLVNTRNITFDNEEDSHWSSNIYEESGYNLDVDLATVS